MLKTNTRSHLVVLFLFRVNYTGSSTNCIAPPPLFQAEFEYKLLGYAPEDYPGFIPYTPSMEEQPLLEGPTEELLQGRPCGQLPEALLQQLREPAAVPEPLRQMPCVNLEIGNRYSNQQVSSFIE